MRRARSWRWPSDSRRSRSEILGRVSVFASDEFYLVAGATRRPRTKFESLDQAENGIGLVAAFVQSFVEGTPMDKLGTGFFQSVDGAPGARIPRPARRESDLPAGDDVTVVDGRVRRTDLARLFDAQGFTDV